ncbi:MAG: hypothetical protein Q9163_000104 [Psora crenata]
MKPETAGSIPKSLGRARGSKGGQLRDLLRVVSGPSNCFAATQHRQPNPYAIGAIIGRLDRKRSGQDVDRLLDIRRQMMKDAYSVGDDAEVQRLQTLGLFDGVYDSASPDGPAGGEEANEELPVGENEPDNGFHGPSTVRPSSVLWVRSPIAQKEDQSDYGMSTTRVPDRVGEYDPFLEIATEALHRSKRTGNRAVSSNQHSGRCGCPSCKGGNSCTRYVRGNGCCIPKPHPNIAAAKEKIAYFRQSPITLQLMRDLEMMADIESGFFQPGSPEIDMVKQRIFIFGQSIVARQLELDTILVDMYDTEMEVRCANDIWWESWLVVGDLRRGGIVGSSPSWRSISG